METLYSGVGASRSKRKGRRQRTPGGGGSGGGGGGGSSRGGGHRGRKWGSGGGGGQVTKLYAFLKCALTQVSFHSGFFIITNIVKLIYLTVTITFFAAFIKFI